MSTFFYDGIEFVLPGIMKACKRKHANQLISNGDLCFTNLSEFQRDEHPERGDPLEGVGIATRNKIQCTSGHINPIFVWCSTMENNPEQILSKWQDRDTVIQITNTLEFARRIQEAIKNKPQILHLQVGPVTYDKDQGSNRDYHWPEATFQKGLHYNNQKEFRFALVGQMQENDMQQKKNILLNIGACTDIVRFEYPHSLS